MTGIYKITNKINGHAYIGYAKDIEERWKEHIRASKNDTRQASKLLYLAFNKYGIDNFNFEVIEQCSLEQLQEREIYWIEYFDTFNNGYNMTKGGDGGYIVGEHNPRAIVTEEDVRFIRQQYANGASKIEVYRTYFSNLLTYNGFAAIWQGKKWTHIMPEVFTKENKERHIHRELAGKVNIGQNNPRSKLTNEQVCDIIKLLEEGKESQTNIAKKFNVNYNTINTINCCKSWTHLHNYQNNIRQEAKERRQKSI